MSLTFRWAYTSDAIQIPHTPILCDTTLFSWWKMSETFRGACFRNFGKLGAAVLHFMDLGISNKQFSGAGANSVRELRRLGHCYCCCYINSPNIRTPLRGVKRFPNKPLPPGRSSQKTLARMRRVCTTTVCILGRFLVCVCVRVRACTWHTCHFLVCMRTCAYLCVS